VTIKAAVVGNGPRNANRRTCGAKAAGDGAEREIGQNAAFQLLAFFRATRPISSLVAGAMSASILIAVPGRLSLLSVAAGLAMTALAMFGFVVNDVFDYHKDAVAGVRRPIAEGELSIREAVILAVGLLALVFLLSTIVASGGMVLVITSLGLVAYSPIAQRYPLGKGALVAGLCCSPLLYGSVVGGIPCPWFSYTTLACFVFGRETLMDAEELIGDRLAGLATIPVVLGCRRARRIGIAVMFLSTIGLVVVARSNVGRIAATAMLLCLVCVFFLPGLSDATRIKLSRIPMLVGAVAIAIGSK
jgi:chlorophyll/bacteriochlorophyll a synthase